MLLQNSMIDLELTTQENEYSALCAAAMAGHYEVVQFLAENGADVNFMNSMGQTPLVHCFSRMTETENVFENKNICLKIAEVLLSYGADINKVSYGRTQLMNFCAISMKLDPVMLEMSLHVVKFLMMNGADPYQKCDATLKDSFELAANHCAST